MNSITGNLSKGKGPLWDFILVNTCKTILLTRVGHQPLNALNSLSKGVNKFLRIPVHLSLKLQTILS